MSQLPYLLLDGYMKLSNHLTLRVHKIGNVLLVSFCNICMLFLRNIDLAMVQLVGPP
jgi:hypothetical protein